MPSSHLNLHSSHMIGHLLLWVSLCLATELLRVQKYVHSSHLYGRSLLWKGLDSNQYSDSSHLYGFHQGRKVVLLQISPSSHLNLHSSHLYERSPLWEGPDSNHYCNPSHFCGRLLVWEGLHSNLRPSKSRSRSGITIFTDTIRGKCQNLPKSFFTFLIFIKVWPVWTKVTDKTDRHRRGNGQAHSYMRNLADLPKNRIDRNRITL